MSESLALLSSFHLLDDTYLMLRNQQKLPEGFFDVLFQLSSTTHNFYFVRFAPVETYLQAQEFIVYLVA